MLSNQSVKNEKPQDKAGTKSQGQTKLRNGNSTTLTESKARWEKGQELFRSGAVSIGKDGYFRVNGFKVDTPILSGASARTTRLESKPVNTVLRLWHS